MPISLKLSTRDRESVSSFSSWSFSRTLWVMDLYAKVHGRGSLCPQGVHPHGWIQPNRSSCTIPFLDWGATRHENYRHALAPMVCQLDFPTLLTLESEATSLSLSLSISSPLSDPVSEGIGRLSWLWWIGDGGRTSRKSIRFYSPPCPRIGDLLWATLWPLWTFTRKKQHKHLTRATPVIAKNKGLV